MADRRPIDLFVGLRDLSRTTKSGKVSKRFGLRIKVPDGPIFDTDERKFMGPVGEVIAATLTENLLRGKKPDGTAMKPISSATARRREKEAAQGRRGGDAHQRYDDPKFRARVKRNYERDYKSRIGQFTPQEGRPRGVVSGLLAASFKARAVKSGDGFIVFVSGNRARPRPGEAKSAVETVFQDIRFWNDVAMRQDVIQEALQGALDGILQNRKSRFFQAARRTLSNLERLRKEAEDLG